MFVSNRVYFILEVLFVFFLQICKALKKANVEIYSGPQLSDHLTFGPPRYDHDHGTDRFTLMTLCRAEKLAKEYGDLSCTVEIVPSMEAAVEHIHR